MLLKRIENLNLKNQYPMKNLLVIPVLAGLTLFSMSMTSEKTPEKISTATIIEKGEPDSEPEYPGGSTALMQFLGSEAHYPKSLESEGAEGKVFVQFVVSKTGEVTEVSIARSSSFDAMDKEAIRMIKKMPDWNPGKKDGLPVSTKMTLPIVFKLS